MSSFEHGAVRPVAVPARRRATPRRRTSWTLRAAGARCPAGRRCARPAARPVRGAPRRVEVFGVRLPEPGRAGRRDGQGRRRAARLAGARASASSRSARSPRTRSRATTGRGCSGCRPARRSINRMGFNNAGAAALAARLRGARARSACRWASPSASPRSRRWTRRSTTTWPSYKLLRAVRRLHRGQRLLAEHARACARCRTGRTLRRAAGGALVGPATAGAGEDRARPDRRRRSRELLEVCLDARRGRGDRHQHHARPGTAWPRPTQPRAGEAGGLSGRPLTDAGPRGGAVRAQRDRRRAADHRRRRHRSTRTTRPGCSTPARAWCSSTPASSTAARPWCARSPDGAMAGREDSAPGR